jgi:hypothetical protein
MMSTSRSLFSDVCQAAVKFGCATAEEFDALVKPEDMTQP